MKKAINLIVVSILVFSLLTACSSKDSPTNNTSNSNSDSNSNNTSNPTSTSQVDESKIASITDFSNGLAFVQYIDDKNTYCIDKSGKQLFVLENCNIYNFAKFNTKIAMIQTTNINEYILCDKQGKIYTAEDFSASRIVLDTNNHKQAFLDGYIILERREESYTGTKIEMSVIDSDFTTLVPFSVELAEIINSNIMNVNGTNYYDGYLYFEDTILDLRTGTKSSDRTQMSTKVPKLSYWANGTYGTSGFYDHLEWGDIYNALTGEVIAKVKESENISNIFFVGDLGLARYHSDNGTWFNIIAQDGNTKFEPIKAEGSEMRFDGETILTLNKCKVEKENAVIEGLSVKSYDVLGTLLGEIVLEDWSWGGSLSLNDGVIKVYNIATKEISLYNSALEELF